ncbi:hypothetical protein G7Z17_g8946 [Cylindrodendrum hubeiense]|uniref:Cerato-platanin n=1 Tax=Cylindrodendrum hubeiense TaxID=595255 RepID=A0A9P5LDU0_9HYPO|nr:hypothetical protein G7Z17_g8946 [Cylindrodendrum hubeiense]
MFASFTALLAAASATLVSAAAIAPRGYGSASMTPHDAYGSSIGVLGCKINTNHVAYWPEEVGCDDICMKLSHGGRSIYMLRIDQSTGFHDISYAAWVWLGFHKYAAQDPVMGGGIEMDYQTVHPSKCHDLLDDGKLPLMAANSMNYLASCLAQPKSWVANNYRLYNIANDICKYGVDELCTVDLTVSNQPSCPSGLGSTAKLSLKVTNIAYGTGEKVQAL